jgi:hypothetical protein
MKMLRSLMLLSHVTPNTLFGRFGTGTASLITFNCSSERLESDSAGTYSVVDVTLTFDVDEDDSGASRVRKNVHYAHRMGVLARHGPLFHVEVDDVAHVGSVNQEIGGQSVTSYEQIGRVRIGEHLRFAVFVANFRLFDL